MTDIEFQIRTGKNRPDYYEDTGATTLASVAAAEGIQADSDGNIIIIPMDGYSKCSIECINTHATATCDFAVYKTNSKAPTYALIGDVTGNDSHWEIAISAVTVAAHGQDMLEYNKEDEGLCMYLILTGLNSTAGALAIAEFIILRE